jgi:hypothetical protein
MQIGSVRVTKPAVILIVALVVAVALAVFGSGGLQAVGFVTAVLLAVTLVGGSGMARGLSPRWNRRRTVSLGDWSTESGAYGSDDSGSAAEADQGAMWAKERAHRAEAHGPVPPAD